MKILFIASSSFDYSQDIVFSGLVKLLGSRAITHWRLNINFILPLKRYPKNMGLHGEGWRTMSMYFPDPKKYDAIIVGSCKPDTFNTYLSLIEKIPVNVPVIFIDGGDREDVGGDFDRLGQSELFIKAQEKRMFNWIFKREYLIRKQYDANVKPLPFGFNLSRILDLPIQKKYDVAFWASRSDPIRTKVLRKIEGKFDCAQNGSTDVNLDQKFIRRGNFYLQELAACKISLNFRGAGWDTLRYWEIAAVGGFMISQRPAIEIPNNFEHNKHVIFCEPDLSNLIELCDYYLKNEKERERMALAAKQHVHAFHTDVERAKTVLSVLR
ncbi:MAG: glycosyltransferase family 1 protein [Cytophagia bacterium]|nr:glycosyltransferase family 1 protein [Cytophagia bacterium]